MLAGLALISVSTVAWVAVMALMFLQDSNDLAKTIAARVSPGGVGLLNLFLCAGGIVCSRVKRRTAQPTAALRRGIAASSSVLMLLWFFLALNPH